jgi:hypothetical protein
MTGKPMDPARLALLRRTTQLAKHKTLIDELLADRDYHAQRAEELQRRSESLCEVEAALRYASHSIPAIRDRGPCEAIGVLSAEVARLRARVRVEAEDVGRAGVTRAHVEAWLRASGWAQSATEDGWHSEWGRSAIWRIAPYDPRGVQVYETDDREAIVRAVRSVAHHFDKPGLDILEEMAAMAVEPR